MFKQASPYVLKVILHLFNRSWETGFIPSAWRKAHIIPLLKPGKDPNFASSYRPISLTSHLCKIMEHLIKRRMEYMLGTSTSGVEPIHDSQAGFRKGRTTTEQIAYISGVLNENYATQKYSNLMLFDFKNAFDTVWHEGLIFKLRQKGFPEQYIRWIRNFLLDRRASVAVNGLSSQSLPMRAGVPQGSVLAPLLFSIYIDDLARGLVSLGFTSLYADDVAVVVSGHRSGVVNVKAQKVVTYVEDWCSKWGMTLSREKTIIMRVSPSLYEDLENVNVHYTSSRRTDDVHIFHEQAYPVIHVVNPTVIKPPYT